jgi:hypothetical protein
MTTFYEGPLGCIRAYNDILDAEGPQAADAYWQDLLACGVLKVVPPERRAAALRRDRQAVALARQILRRRPKGT